MINRLSNDVICEASLSQQETVETVLAMASSQIIWVTKPPKLDVQQQLCVVGQAQKSNVEWQSFEAVRFIMKWFSVVRNQFFRMTSTRVDVILIPK